MTAEERAALERLAIERRPFFAATYHETWAHRQLVMKGYASCRVEHMEYISIRPEGRQALNEISARADNSPSIDYEKDSR